MNKIREIADSYHDQLIEYRRHFHRHPELSFQEVQTAAWIRNKLAELHVDTVSGVRGNSTVGIIKGEEEGPVLLFRADIDALPLTEETGLPFASEVPGVMHACGHDAHIATLMCFVDYMSKHRELIKGTIKFVFQQGEDCTPGGGRYIVEDGILDDVDHVFAWHCAPEAEISNIIAASGPRTASFDNYEIHIKGKGGHAGFPQRSIDPVSTGALIVSAINQLPVWTQDPLDAVTMIVSRFDGGTHGAYNIIPDNVVIEGNIRSHNNDTAKKLLARVKEVAEGICKAKQCDCEFIHIEGYPALINDKEVTEMLRDVLCEEGIRAIDGKPIMGAEDFGFYTQVKPGTFFNVGIHNPGKPETSYPPHNPHFCIEEDAMIYALATFLTCYREMTKPENYQMLLDRREHL